MPRIQMEANSRVFCLNEFTTNFWECRLDRNNILKADKTIQSRLKRTWVSFPLSPYQYQIVCLSVSNFFGYSPPINVSEIWNPGREDFDKFWVRGPRGSIKAYGPMAQRLIAIVLANFSHSTPLPYEPTHPAFVHLC